MKRVTCIDMLVKVLHWLAKWTKLLW